MFRKNICIKIEEFSLKLAIEIFCNDTHKMLTIPKYRSISFDGASCRYISGHQLQWIRLMHTWFIKFLISHLNWAEISCSIEGPTHVYLKKCVILSIFVQVESFNGNRKFNKIEWVMITENFPRTKMCSIKWTNI